MKKARKNASPKNETHAITQAEPDIDARCIDMRAMILKKIIGNHKK
jgi:hypothetical protein